MGYIWKFDNVETQNKHEVSLGSFLLKMQLSFLKILASEFLWWCRINAQAWQVTGTFISCLKLQDEPFLLITKKAIFFQNLSFYNAPRTWAIDNGSNNGAFSIQESSNLQWRGFILDGFAFLEKILNFWQCSPWRGVPDTCHKFYLYIFTWKSH